MQIYAYHDEYQYNPDSDLTSLELLLYRSPPEAESEPVQVSVVSALEEVTKSSPNLNAYLALNDSIVHLILNRTCPAGSSTALQASYKIYLRGCIQLVDYSNCLQSMQASYIVYLRGVQLINSIIISIIIIGS